MMVIRFLIGKYQILNMKMVDLFRQGYEPEDLVQLISLHRDTFHSYSNIQLKRIINGIRDTKYRLIACEYIAYEQITLKLIEYLCTDDDDEYNYRLTRLLSDRMNNLDFSDVIDLAGNIEDNEHMMRMIRHVVTHHNIKCSSQEVINLLSDVDSDRYRKKIIQFMINRLTDDAQLADFDHMIRRSKFKFDPHGKRELNFPTEFVSVKINFPVMGTFGNLALAPRPIVSDKFPPDETFTSRMVKTEIDPCGICYQHVPDWTLFPCLHTFCGLCITKSKNANHDNDEEKNFNCPSCRATIYDMVQVYSNRN